MKTSLYEVMLKLSHVSRNACSAACTCPACIRLGDYSNFNNVGGVLYALEDFKWKILSGQFALNQYLAH